MTVSTLNSFTLNEWVFEIKNLLGIGVSDDDMYPLSTYHPINKEQVEIIKNYFYLYHDKSSEYESLVEKISNRLFTKNIQYFTFNDIYPKLEYFQQAIANASSFIDANLEVYPGIVYHPISNEQHQRIIDEFNEQSVKNPIYTSSDMKNFASNIVLMTDTPLNVLPSINFDGTDIQYA